MRDLLSQDVADTFLHQLGGFLKRMTLLLQVFGGGASLIECVLLGILRRGPIHIVVNIVDYILVFADVRNDIDMESVFINDHIGTNLLHRECDGLLNLLEVLQLFYLIVRELILCCY